jgi:hypothetical protein
LGFAAKFICYAIDPVIDDIIDDDTDDGVLFIMGGAFDETPPLYDGLLSKEVALALTPLFSYSIDEKVGLNDVVVAGATAVGGFGATREVPIFD